MSIFSEVKEHVTARRVAEFYGLKVGNNGVACCPFHDDKHPSMKIDIFYYCFACGAKGDAINYVAEMYGLPLYEAAKKIVHDFHIIVESNIKQNDKARGGASKARAEEQKQKQMLHIQNKFKEWCNKTIAKLRDCEQVIESAKKYIQCKPPDEIFQSEDFLLLLHKKPLVGY